VAKSSGGNAFVEFQHVQKSYDGETLVVKDLNLSMPKGEFLTMLGPSGSGKTTCLMMLAGFETATHGEIMLDGQPINNIPPHKRGIGMVFQNYALFPHMTVAENLAFPLEVRKMGKSERDEKVKRALDMVQMGAFGGRRPAQLSGGQQQRIALARAMIKDAPILVLDEATSALDSEVEAAIQSALEEAMKGKTVLAIAHRLSTIARMDRIIVLEAGKIAEEGSHDELLAKDGLYARYWNRQSGGFLGVPDEAAEA